MTDSQRPPNNRHASVLESTAPSEPRAADPKPTTRTWLGLGVLVLAVVLLAVDGTVMSLAVPALSADLDPSATQLLWIGDIYSFALAGLLVTMGGFADRFGRKRVLLIGTTAFGVASLLAGLAPSAELLIAARAAQGVAAATLMPSTLSLIRELFPDAEYRTRAVALWAAGAYAGAAAGPLVGGALLEHFWWGSVFVINIPIVVVLLVGAFVLLPESKDPTPGPFDLVGAVLSLLAIVPIVYTVKEIAGHGMSLAPLVTAGIGAAAATAFVRRQRRLAAQGRQPLIDLQLFRMPAFAGALSATFIAVFAFSGLLFFFSQYLQLVRGYGALESGLRALPLTLAAIAVIPLAGPMSRRYGHGMVIGAGLVVAGGGMLLLAAGESMPGYAVLAFALVLTGIGEGFALTLGTDAVLASVPPARAGAASAVSETAYELGVALGIAVLGSAMTILYRSGLEGFPDAVRESLASAVSAGSSSEVTAAAGAFVDAMQVVSVVAAGLLVLAGLVAMRVIGKTTR